LNIPSTSEEKVERYRAFWSNEAVERPLVGFSLGGWFPLQNYRVMEKFKGLRGVAPDQIVPEEFFNDYDRIVAQWDDVEDDLIRAVAAIPPFPWLEAMLGSPVQVGNESIWAEEGGFDYTDLDKLSLSKDNPWRRKYLEFVAALRDHFKDRVPVGQPILRGVSDMIASMRGASQMVLDLYDHPEDFERLARICTNLLVDLVEEQQTVTGPFQGGYEIEQLSLWAPDRVIRIQEDASALFSPGLYVKYLREDDRRQASVFPYSAIHLHSSSLFLLQQILEIDSLNCIQINKDIGGAEVERMIPFFRMVQDRGRRLLVRGKLDHDDLGLLRHNLSPRGLYLQIVIEHPDETRGFREFFNAW
jgi:hypothetical protein